MLHRTGLCTALLLLGALLAVAQPVIRVVQDGAANTPDLAPGSIFVVKGTSLSGAGFVQNSQIPLPTALNGIRISFTPAPGGAAIDAYMVYTYNVGGVNQLAGLLPSSAGLGEYDVRVTNAGQASSAFRVRVVPRKFGIVSADSTGAGQAQATTADFELIRFARGELAGFRLRPVRPGDAVVLWGTGLGADPLSDPAGQTSGDRTTQGQVVVLVDGVEVRPFYAGRASGLPGTDQVNFIVPANARPNCSASVQVRAGGVLSNLVTIAVAAPGAETCPTDRFSEADLRRLSQGQDAIEGIFNLSSVLTESHIPSLAFPAQYSESFIGSIGRITANQIGTEGMSLRPGQCISWRKLGRPSEMQFGFLTLDGLDAGVPIRITGPGGVAIDANRMLNRTNIYLGSATPGPNRNWGPGMYRLQAPGGAGVGPFNAEMTMPPFEWTNRAAVTTINRSAGLTVTWTGGAPGGVNITGFGVRLISGNVLLDQENSIVEGTLFSCIADAAAGTMTVPQSILNDLPPVNGEGGLQGSLGVYAFPGDMGRPFTAPLVGGGAARGYFAYISGYSKILTIQ